MALSLNGCGLPLRPLYQRRDTGNVAWLTGPTHPLPEHYDAAFREAIESHSSAGATELRRLVGSLLTQQLTVSQYLGGLETFRLLSGIWTSQTASEVSRALSGIVSVPSADAALSWQLVWWFFECRTSWLRVTEQDVMREVLESDAKLTYPSWPSHIRTVDQVLGVPFTVFRAAIVVRLALLRLAHTKDRVRQIAYDLDYPHASAMNHHFQAVVGLSPRAFRQLAWGASQRLSVFNSAMRARVKLLTD